MKSTMSALLAMAFLSQCAGVSSRQESKPPEPKPASLLGEGSGIDHVGVAVRHLDQAQRDYEALGFKVGKGGHFPGGIFNEAILFRNSYLELLSVTPPGDPTSGFAMAVLSFLSKHEGAMFLGLDVSSAIDSVVYLKEHHFDVVGPEPGSLIKAGDTVPPAPQWYMVSFGANPASDTHVPNLPIFLIQYLSHTWRDRFRAAGLTDHPNTAIDVHAVWFAVRDVGAQLQMLRDAGLAVEESREAQLLGAQGPVLRAGLGEIVVLGARGKDDPIATYLSGHDDGIIAVSIQVADLSKARAFAESRAGRKIEIYDGAFGKSILLGPDLTHGLWVEMFQR